MDLWDIKVSLVRQNVRRNSGIRTLKNFTWGSRAVALGNRTVPRNSIAKTLKKWHHKFRLWLLVIVSRLGIKTRKTVVDTSGF